MGRSVEDHAVAPTELAVELPVSATEFPIVGPERYQLEQEIGQGGLGRVSRAIDSRFHRVVAIKELRADRSDARTLLLREASLTARLQHPGVAPIYDAGYWPDGSPFYAMKLIEGQTLAARVASARTPVERLGLLPHIIAVADTIAYAHSRGVVHRDIKPANVVVGAFGETVVLDWGIAHRPSGDGPFDSEPGGLDSPGGIAGTVGYMAPEQLRGDPIDARADVFALGASLYHVLAGGPPGSAPAPLVARDLQAILDKALAANPAARYRDAGDMASDLRRFNAGQLVSAHHYSLRTLIARWLRRHRAAVTVAVFLCTVLVTLAAYTIHSELAARSRDADRTRTLTLLQARSSMEGDAAPAIAWLKTLDARDDLGPLRIVAAAAQSRGVARRIWRAHHNSIYDMAVSPDGRIVATSSRDRTAKLFDVALGTTVELFGHTDEIFDVTFDAGGSYVATASGDGTARVWDLQGREIWRVDVWAIAGKDLRPDLEDAIIHVELLDGGRTLVTGDRVGRISITERGKTPLLLARLGSAIDMLRLSPDRRVVAARGVNGKALLARLDGSGFVELSHPVGRVGFAWLGDHVATAFGPTISVWSSAGEVVDQLVLDADISRVVPDGNRLLAGDAAGVVHVWSPGTADRRLGGGSSPILALAALAPNRIATGSPDGRIRLYDFDRGVVLTMRGHDGLVDHVGVVHNALVSAGADGTVRIWPNELPVEVLAGAGTGVETFSAEPGGAVAIGREDGAIDLFPGHRVAAPGKSLFDVAISGPARRVAYSYDHEMTVVGWDGSTIGVVPLDGKLAFLAWAPDGSRLAASSSTDRIAVYDASLRLVRELRVGGNVEARLAFAGDEHLVSAGWDGTVRLWDLSTGENRLLARHAGPALAIAISSGSNLVASVGTDGVVLLHDLSSGAMRALGRHNGALNRVVFTPDDRVVVSGGRDLALGVWNVDGTPGRLLRGHRAGITWLCVSHDGRLAATAAQDGTVRLWDLDSGKSETLENVGKDPIVASFLTENRLLTAAGDGTVRVLGLDMPSDSASFRRWLDEMTSLTIE